jgi:hypothetical protein
MKMTTNQIESLVRRTLAELEKKKLVSFNKSKEAVFTRGREIIEEDYQKEAKLEEEVMRMLDDIEKEQTDQFERHRMFKMLKKKIADERGIVL